VLILLVDVLDECVFGVVEHDFLEDEVLVVVFAQIVDLEIEVELAYRVRRWLIFFAMQALQVRMRQCIGYRDALARIEHQHLL